LHQARFGAHFFRAIEPISCIAKVISHRSGPPTLMPVADLLFMILARLFPIATLIVFAYGARLIRP
jgi:hypothetical protein